jgi:hypothetical protein
MLGRWDEALDVFAQVPDEHRHEGVTESFLSSLPDILIARGDVEGAARVLALYAPYRESDNLQRRAMYLAGAAVVARAQGRLDEAVVAGLEATESSRDRGDTSSQAIKLGLVEAVEAGIALGEPSKVEELVATIEAVPPGLRSPYLGAQVLRFRGRPATGDAAESLLDAAAKRFAELSIPFWRAVTLLELGELAGDDAALEEAREIFEDLKATPWIERCDAATSVRAEVPA